MALVSLWNARSDSVFVPDMPEDIVEHIAREETRALLAIDRIKGVQKPITEQLRHLGVKSLREKLGEPVKVEGQAPVNDAGEKLVECLDKLRSTGFQTTFDKRLGELGVELRLLRGDWRKRLGQIRSIKFAEDVNLTYRFLHGKRYTVSGIAGFDPHTGTFWVKREHGIDLRAFCEAVAAHRIFKPDARPVDTFALERVLTMDFEDTGLDFSAPSAEEWDDQADVGAADDSDTELSEVSVGHSPYTPNPDLNIPDPGPLTKDLLSSSRPRVPVRRKSAAHEAEDTKSTPAIEEAHKSELRRHYANHCQMCLCRLAPDKLAPIGSYVETAEVRRKVLEIHHVDYKSAGGARQGGNLILLCDLHHHNYGRRLSRAAVTLALAAEPISRTIRFTSDSGNSRSICGRIVKLTISDTKEEFEIFFTKEHADYWIANAN